jgi:hypothetical protein
MYRITGGPTRLIFRISDQFVKSQLRSNLANYTAIMSVNITLIISVNITLITLWF